MTDEIVLRILSRCTPVLTILLVFIAVDSLITWGSDLELLVFNFAPLLSIVFTNFQALNTKLGFLLYKGKPVLRISFYGLFHILVIYFVFTQMVALMMPILEEHEYSKGVTYRFSFFISKVKPIVSVNTFRFPGEDVEFRCKTHMNDKTKSVWKYKGLAIKESWRHLIGSALKPENITTLSINHLEESDFGEYSCWLYVHMNHRIYEFKTKEFILIQRSYLEFDSKIPLSGVFTTLISYRSHVEEREDEEDELEFLHMVDGQEKSHLCSAKDSSYILLIYRTLKKLQHTDGEIRRARENDLTHFHTMISMCPQAFGVHTFSVLRRTYNTSSKRWVIAEIDIPIKFNVTPKRSPYLAYFINTTNSSEYFTGSIDFLADYAFFLHTGEVMFICLLIILYIIPTSKLINTIIEPFIFATLTFFMNKWIVHYYNHHGRGENEALSVFIACEETDASWCSTVLSPVFESLGHNTYIPLRDTPGGQGELGGIWEGMGRCSRYVIVISENDRDASPLWQHEAEVILDRLVRGELQEYNILIVTLNHASYSPVDKVCRVKEITCLELCKDISFNDRSLDGVIRWLLSSRANNLLQY